MNTWKIVIVLIALVGAVILDIKTKKIPNVYNGVMIIFGVGAGLIFGGIKGLVVSLVGGLIPLCLIVLFSRGVLGGGDIKLLMALGTFAGLEVIWLLIYSFLLCGIYGLALMVIRLVRWATAEGVKGELIVALTRNRLYTKLPFSIFVLGGYLWYLGKGGFLLGI